jgi:hypothetical protein
MRETMIKANIPVIYMKEGDSFVCYCPAFDLVAHGDSFEDAGKSFTTTLKLFIQEVTKKGTWNRVLKEYGWEKEKNEWRPPRIIGQENKSVKISASV